MRQTKIRKTLPFTVTAMEGTEFECTEQEQNWVKYYVVLNIMCLHVHVHVLCAALYLNCFLQDHIGQCLRFPLPCPNSCGVSIPREKVRHLLVLSMIMRHIIIVRWLLHFSSQYRTDRCLSQISGELFMKTLGHFR